MDTLKVGTYSVEKGQPLYPDSSPGPVQPARTCRRSFFKRTWIIFGMVTLAWLILSCAKRAFSGQHRIWHWVDEEFRLVPPTTEGDVNHCVNSTSWTTYYEEPSWTPDHPLGAETAFSLPLDSDALYLISRGPFQYGVVNIEQSTEVFDVVDVRVRVAYFDDEALEHATVCQLERAENEHGVGIFTRPIKPHRHQRFPDDKLRFDVTLTLPAGNEAPLLVKKLETKMPNYSQKVADLEKSVFFDQISLTSANGLLSIQSVACEVGRFSSLNGDIGGRFSAQSFLILNTLNGGITPTVNLLDRLNEDSPKLTVHTANGHIDAEISLTSESLVGGEFEVDAKLKNGDVGLKFTDTPVDSVLRCRAETAAGAIDVELDSAFEGTYSLQSLVGKKTVSQSDVEDPAGKGRQREITQNVAFGQVEGEIKWVESDGSSSENEGRVTLKALMASVKLVV